MSTYSGSISIESIIMDYINKSAHLGNLNEELVYIAAEEALDEIITGDGLFEYIVLLGLHNQKAQIPSNFKYPTQVAYRPPFEVKTKPNDLRRYFLKTINNDYDQNVRLDACTTCKENTCCCETKEWYPIETTDTYVKLVKEPILASGYSKFLYGVQNKHSNNKTLFLSELPHNRGEHIHKDHTRHRIIPTFSRSAKCPEFQIVRPKSNYFFNLPNELKYCNMPSYDTNLEYKIQDRIIELNNYEYRCNQCSSCKRKSPCEMNLPMEKYGEVLISYLGHKIDENGFRMIPDEKYLIRAVSDYIVTYMARIEYAMKRDAASERYWKNMQAMSDVSVIRARSRYRIPPPDKMDHFIDNVWFKKSQHSRNADSLNRFIPELSAKLTSPYYTESDYNDYSLMFRNDIQYERGNH